MTDKIAERALVLISLNYNISTVATVATIRATARNKNLLTKAAASIPAITIATIKNDSIRKHNSCTSPDDQTTPAHCHCNVNWLAGAGFHPDSRRLAAAS